MSDSQHTTGTNPVSLAYRLGEEAYLSQRISLGAHALYRHFVAKANVRGFCWWGIEKLCQVFRRCERTIGRWIAQLVNAELIEREYHRGVAHTYITAIRDPEPEQVSFLADGMSDLDRTLSADPSIKEESLKAGGGGGASAPHVADATEAEAEPETVQDLRSAGVVSAKAIARVAHIARARVRDVIGYVASQPRLGPGLIIDMLANNTPIPTPRPSQQRSRKPQPQRIQEPQPTPEEFAAGVAAYAAEAEAIRRQYGLA